MTTVIVCGLTLVAETAGAETFETCADVRSYLGAPLPSDPYRKVQELGQALDVLRAQSGDACDDWVAERTRFEYASALDSYSRTFGDGSAAARAWADRAAGAYREYLDWFLDLADAQQDQLIRMLTKTRQATAEIFRKERGKWLRNRVGNAVHGMGAAFIRADAHDRLFSEYDRLFRITIEIFPNEAARQWHLWLRRKPDYRVSRSDGEIRKMLSEDPDCFGLWSSFKEFLDAFVAANPSIRTEWDVARKRIELWLAT